MLRGRVGKALGSCAVSLEGFEERARGEFRLHNLLQIKCKLIKFQQKIKHEKFGKFSMIIAGDIFEFSINWRGVLREQMVINYNRKSKDWALIKIVTTNN